MKLTHYTDWSIKNMKKILVTLLVLLTGVSLFADTTVYGEVKGSATSNFSTDLSTGEDSEVEARIGIKGSNGVTSFKAELKATDYGFNGDYIDGKEKGDDSERTYPFFEEAWFKVDAAEYFELDNIILDITAGIVKVEGSRKARYTVYENEDISVTNRKGRELTDDKVRVYKDWTSPNLILEAGIPVVRFRGGLNIEETADDSFEYMAGLIGEWSALNYEAYYFNDGLLRDAEEDEEADDVDEYVQKVMASVSYDSFEIANVELLGGVTYVWSLDSNVHSYGGGLTVEESTLLPVELNLSLDGEYDADNSENYLFDGVLDTNIEVLDFLTVKAGAIFDFRDYSDYTFEPGVLRVADICLNFEFGKSEIGVGYAHIFDHTLVENVETLYAYAEDAKAPNFYVNVKSKF